MIDALGQHIFSNFVLKQKRLEWASFRQTVSRVGREQYLELY